MRFVKQDYLFYNTRMKNPFESFGSFKSKAEALSMSALLLMGARELPAQSVSTLKNEATPFPVVRIETSPSQNMPAGFRRDKLVILDANGKEKPGASLFYFDDSTQARFITKSQNPDVFSPEINYAQADTAVRESGGGEIVIGFEAAYEDGKNLGSIEGVAVQDGVEINGAEKYSKSGFVYITPTGNMEMHRYAKDPATKQYDTLAVEQLIHRAKTEGGSLFQQLPAIWEGIERLDAHSPQKFEYRAICQTKDGKHFIFNCTEKITLRNFLILALNLKDANGDQLVYDLMLTDTGEYSEGMFRDNNQIQDTTGFKSYAMVDEGVKNNKTGYTNILTIGTGTRTIGSISTKNALPVQQQKQTQPVQQTNPTEPTPYTPPDVGTKPNLKTDTTETYYTEPVARQKNYQQPRNNRGGSQYIPQSDQQTYPGSGGETYPGSRHPDGQQKNSQNIVYPR
jgi:hypothetical protein